MNDHERTCAHGTRHHHWPSLTVTACARANPLSIWTNRVLPPKAGAPSIHRKASARSRTCTIARSSPLEHSRVLAYLPRGNKCLALRGPSQASVVYSHTELSLGPLVVWACIVCPGTSVYSPPHERRSCATSGLHCHCSAFYRRCSYGWSFSPFRGRTCNPDVNIGCGQTIHIQRTASLTIRTCASRDPCPRYYFGWFPCCSLIRSTMLDG